MNGIYCYIGMGSNIGDSIAHCQTAIEKLSEVEGISITDRSSFYKTEPVGIESREYFINAVLEVKTRLDAFQLLDVLLQIEENMGRTRKDKRGSRIIDLDLLFYGQDIIRNEKLIVPHPEIHKRRFVLEPMCEIASFFIHPSFGISMKGLKDRLNDNKWVQRMKA
jgi:2-amino-4-hydroxy-6-hydroxymethyldihydropteridine diphosphokinase